MEANEDVLGVVTLYSLKADAFNEDQLRAALMTPNDVRESVRQKIGSRSLDKVAAAILERNGEVSVIRKEQ